MARASKKTLKKKLDNLARDRCRAKGKCEAKGYRKNNYTKAISCSQQLQWCHIKSRRYLSVRWSEDNCFCLCAAHHRYFTDNPDDFISFCWDKHPNKMLRLDQQFRPVYPIKNWQLEALYEQLKEKWK